MTTRAGKPHGDGPDRALDEAEVRAIVGELVAAPLAQICGGDTALRWRTMVDWARRADVGCARLAEAHADATAIWTEAGVDACSSDSLAGVWASEGRAPVRLSADSGFITGAKAFCSGIGIVDRALVTVVDDRDRHLLVEVALCDDNGGDATTAQTTIHPWETPALQTTRTGTVTFAGHPVERVLGGPGWYLERPGFWHGAIGPAACWAGAAAAFVDEVDPSRIDDPFRAAARGEMRAEAMLALAVLAHAGSGSDADPHDVAGARHRAYAARHLIERSCTRLLDAYERAWGPRPFVSSRGLAQRAMDLRLYLRQQHGMRDLAALGAAIVTGEPAPKRGR